jgi:putative transposase
MPTFRPPFLPGHYYHLFNRGAHRQPIFHEPSNYTFVLNKIRIYCREFSLTPIAYALLPNHYHFCVRQDGELAAGKLPQYVFNSYTKAYNIRYQHSGTLFEGHYRAILVDKDAYLVHLCRYIHANPVAHGLVEHPADWPYTNYLEWVGERKGTLYDPSFVHAHFPDQEEYQIFVMDYLRTRDLPDDFSKHLENLEA